MGDHVIRSSGWYGPSDESRSRTPADPIPPQVLARWAAMASERAYFAMLPHQVEAGAHA